MLPHQFVPKTHVRMNKLYCCCALPSYTPWFFRTRPRQLCFVAVWREKGALQNKAIWTRPHENDSRELDNYSAIIHSIKNTLPTSCTNKSTQNAHIWGSVDFNASKSYGQASWHRLKWWSQHHFKHIIIATRSEWDSFQTCEISVARTFLPINSCKGVLSQAWSPHSNIPRLAFDASWGIRLKRQCSPRFLFLQRQIIIPRRQDWCLCTVCGNAHSCVVG